MASKEVHRCRLMIPSFNLLLLSRHLSAAWCHSNGQKMASLLVVEDDGGRDGDDNDDDGIDPMLERERERERDMMVGTE